MLKTTWWLVILLMPVALLNYLDRQMLASMKSSVMLSVPELNDPETKERMWGFMLGQFKWVYAILSPVGGYVADRWSRKFTICLSLFAWSAVTFWTGTIDTYEELLWARTAMGFSEAFYIPAALALIANTHASETRSRAVGLHQMAIYLGVIAGGFGGYVADDPGLGWRFAFYACGVIGMLYAVPLTILLKDTRDTDEAYRPRVRFTQQEAETALLSNRSFLLLVLYFTLPAMAAWVVRDWMPTILKQQFNLGQGKAGVSATLYWQLSAIVFAVVGGSLADTWIRRNPRGRIYTSAIGMLVISTAILGIGYAETLTEAVLFLALFGAGWGFFDINNMPILSQIVRPELRATGYGVMNFVSISCGGLADWSFGYLRDVKVPLHTIFGLYSAAALVSVALVLLIKIPPVANSINDRQLPTKSV
jgi:MFS family permease